VQTATALELGLEIIKYCEYSLMVKLNLAKVMTRVRFPLFARIPILASLNDISLDRGSWLCSSKEEHWPVEPEVAVSGSVRVAYIIKYASLAQLARAPLL
jgi:hypothetical protein